VSNDPNLRRTAELTNLVGQVGCVTGFLALFIIGAAFAAGWLIDGWMGNERKFVTVIFLLGSFPVTLYAMVRISLWMVARAEKSIERLDSEDRNKPAV
jgi:biotin transporter BioY